MRFFSTIVLLASLNVRAQGVNFYSLEKEAALGAQLAQDIRQRTAPVDSDAVRDYVQRIGSRLASQFPEPRYNFTYAVITGDEGGELREPLSFPGGFILVPARLFLTAMNEAEFAGMLAHAMAHVAARHGTRQATRGEAAQLATIPLVFVGGSTGVGGQILVPVGFLQFQRAFELEADALAVKVASAAGYDPEALVRYVGRVQPDIRGKSIMYSALPPRDTRIAEMRKAIEMLSSTSYSPTEEFPRIQDEVRRLSRP